MASKSRTGLTTARRITTMAAVLAACACLAPAAGAVESTVQVIYSFTGGADGKYPEEALVERDGVFYGTTSRNAGNANGTVFRLTPGTGSTVTVTSLHGFSAQWPGHGVPHQYRWHGVPGTAFLQCRGRHLGLRRDGEDRAG